MAKLVKDLMISEYDQVPEEESIYGAVKKITASRRSKIACVVDKEGRLKGLLTPRDILEALEVRKFGTIRGRFFVGPEVLHLLTSKYVRDIMSAPISVHVDDEIEEAVNTMLDHGFYELPVVDKEERVIGEISYFDILVDSLEEGGKV
ncbi:MAG TPA: CBS domain-containing protein [Dehalococcoidia bacterium]|nr:CBS domain-containing protein [Dehalococcoidia bacterium]